MQSTTHFESSLRSTMSDDNFKTPCEKQAHAPLFLANRGQLLDVDGNYSLSLSPDSANCNFNLGERGNCSSPDLNSLSTNGPLMEPSNGLTQRNLSAMLENSFITTSDNTSIYLWNDTFSMLNSEESHEGRSSAAESPDSVGMSSCGTSCRGSMDLSFSSGEILVRSNSLIQEEQTVPVVLSSLEESPALPVTSHAESNFLLSPLVEQAAAESHACRTFVIGDNVELPSEEFLALFHSSLALPDEKARVGTTFVCEHLPSVCVNEGHFIYSEAETLNESDSPKIPDQAVFDMSVCVEPEKDIHTCECNNLLLCMTASEGNNCEEVSPLTVGQRLCGTSCRGSMDFSCSSAEMVLRSNSFILEEPAVSLVLSSLEDSPAPAVMSQTDSKLFLTPMCKSEGEGEHAGSHPCLGMTFLLGENVELPSEEDVAMCSTSIALPDEKACLRTTFLCENSPADFANEARFINSDTELLNDANAPKTPVQAITFDTPLSAAKDVKEDICTSTPLQNIGSNLSSLPTFAVSPCTENISSPALRPVLRQTNPVTPKHFERGISVSSSKVTKMEMSNFPKSDPSGVKCKRDAVSSSAWLDKPSQMNKVGSFRSSPTRSNANVSPCSKAVHTSPRRLNLGSVKEQINFQKNSPVEKQMKSKPVAHTQLVHCSAASPDAEEGTSSQASAGPQAHIANATFCYPEKSLQKRDKTISKPNPKNDVTDKMKKVKLDSKLPNSCLCTSSEGATTVSKLLKMVKPKTLSASFTFSKSKTETLKSQNKPVSQDHSSPSRSRSAMKAVENNCRKVKKIGLVVDPKTLTQASCSTDTNTRVCGQPSPNLTGRTTTSKAPAASPMTATPLNKQKFRTTAAVASPLSKQKPAGNVRATGGTSLAATPAARAKPASSQHHQTTLRSSLMGPPKTPASRLQQSKTSGSTRNQNESAAHREVSDSTRTPQVSGVAGRRPTPFKVPILKPRLATTPAKTNAPVLTVSPKTLTTTRGQPSSPPKRTSTARLSATVDKGKSKLGARPQQQPPGERGTTRPQRGTGAHDAVPTGITDVRIRQLQAQLTQSNDRFEAFAVVLQQTLAQRDEAVRQSRGLSQELLELRGELMHTVNRSEGLTQEKEALKASLQEALEQVQAQHQRDLLELEQRLKEQHQSDISAAQQRLREEAESSRERLQLQMEELRAAHENVKQDLETSHSQQLQSARQQLQRSLQELRDIHAEELQSLNKTLKDVEMVLNERIRELTQENAALTERLAEEENKSRDMPQKDSHKVYLERELESLNVVLDLKTEQLRQQEKKLMEVDKLTEKHVKLEESLRRVQQENEELKARMDRHAALSRQLSTEQALLQESLQKESKVNKRLSMENEELLWKLHNGDMTSPRKASPNPPSPHFSLQSPRTPSLFSSPPVSPR